MFACRMGPATAFYETLASTGQILTPELAAQLFPDQPVIDGVHQTPSGTEVRRYVYQTYACGIDGGDAKEAEARLAEHFYGVIQNMAPAQLVWRRKPHFESQEIIEYGDTFLTSEQIEDEVWKFTDRGNGRVLFTKDAELVLPDNVEMDFATGNYRFVKQKYTRHVMRMRMVMPEFEEAGPAIPSLHKVEGKSLVNKI
jgi:hypothetical protein